MITPLADAFRELSEQLGQVSAKTGQQALEYLERRDLAVEMEELGNFVVDGVLPRMAERMSHAEFPLAVRYIIFLAVMVGIRRGEAETQARLTDRLS